MDQGPIGVFDSGVGGLSVLMEVRKLIPNEDIVYFADSANCPYGNKTPEEIRDLSFNATRYLLGYDAKIIVVACNTASSAALAPLRATFEVPFVGMVPAVKPASSATQTGKIGVIATQATVQAELFADLVNQFAEGVHVLTVACPGLVELVEEGQVSATKTRELLEAYLRPMLQEGIDTVVLGCTHYPFLRPVIREIVGTEVKIMDTGLAVAKQVERVLLARDLRQLGQREGRILLSTSGDEESFLKTARMLMGMVITD